MKLDIQLGIEQVEINDFGDTISINTTDAGFFDRFISMTERLSKLSDKSGKDFDEARNIDNSIEGIVKACRIRVDFAQSAIAEIDSLFGKDTVRKAFRACYESDPEYMPDEDMLASLLTALMPIMETLFKKRYNALNNKYNVSKKGSKSA